MNLIKKYPIKKVRKAGKTTGRKQWKWPEDKPRRPMSAYNYFYRQERQKLLQEMPARISSSSKTTKSRKPNGLGFSALTKNIAVKWKALDDKDKTEFQARAAQDTARYEHEIAAWEKKKQKKEQGTPEPATKQPEGISSNKENHFGTAESLQSMIDLVDLSINALKDAIASSKHQLLLLSAQQERNLISPPVSDKESYHGNISSNENPHGGFIWEQHPYFMNHQETSISLQPLQDEEAPRIEESSTESPMLGFEDILQLIDDDVAADEDTFSLFEDLDFF